MRIDKYLKVSRLIKRRTVANDVADAGRIFPVYNCKVYFIVTLEAGQMAAQIVKSGLGDHISHREHVQFQVLFPPCVYTEYSIHELT